MSASHREQLQAEIQRLRKQNQRFLSDDVFAGWTEEEVAAYDERLERVRSLTYQLEAVNKEI